MHDTAVLDDRRRRHLAETTAIGSRFAVGGGHVYLWSGGTIRLLGPIARRTPPRLTSQTLAEFSDGKISDVEAIPGGVVAVVSSRIHGEGWDTDPRVVIIHGSTARTVMLPMNQGRILVSHVTVAWPKLTVLGTNYVANPVRDAAWVSNDGGTDWTVES